MLQCYVKVCRQTLHFSGGELMKKIVLTLLTGVMLLSNIAITSAKTLDSSKSNASQQSIIHVNTTDPYP